MSIPFDVERSPMPNADWPFVSIYNEDFYLRCVAAGVVVVAFMAYRDYRDGNLHKDDRIGLRYACMEGDLTGAIDNLWASVDDGVSRSEDAHETPEQALEAYIEKYTTRYGRSPINPEIIAP